MVGLPEWLGGSGHGVYPSTSLERQAGHGCDFYTYSRGPNPLRSSESNCGSSWTSLPRVPEALPPRRSQACP